MRRYRLTKQAGIVFVLCLILCVVIASILFVRNMAANQSQQQQQSISPVFTLVEEQLIAPLHIAKTLGTIGIYDEFFASDTPDESQVVAALQNYAKLFNLEFYLAHEGSRKQYNSDGTVFDLIPGEVYWYFDFKDRPLDVQAVLGKQADVHLYIDVRQTGINGEFRGFAGVGKGLGEFLQAFEQFRQKYGHEFVFANNRGEIVLSSRHELLPENLEFKSLSQLSWYAQFEQLANTSEDRSHLVNSSGGDLLISEFTLESLDWRLFIVTPLAPRQHAASKAFMLYALLAMIGLIVLFKLIQKILSLYYQQLSNRINVDPLTNLPNRSQLEQYFAQIRPDCREIALIVVDIDNFKQINDTYGHNAGDQVLLNITRLFSENMQAEGLFGRWGGEEFLFILPEANHQHAMEVATRCCVALQHHSTELPKSRVRVTASFGVSHSRRSDDGLSLLFEQADQAMYQAKRNGRNQVVSANINSRSDGSRSDGSRSDG